MYKLWLLLQEYYYDLNLCIIPGLHQQWKHFLEILMDDQRKLHGNLLWCSISSMTIKETKESVLDTLTKVHLLTNGLIFTGPTLASIDNLIMINCLIHFYKSWPLTSAYPADQGSEAGLVGHTTILWLELEMASRAWVERLPNNSGLEKSYWTWVGWWFPGV